MGDDSRQGGISFAAAAVLFILSTTGLTVFYRSSASYEYGRETLAIALSICGLWLLFFNQKAARALRSRAPETCLDDDEPDEDVPMAILPSTEDRPPAYAASTQQEKTAASESSHSVNQRWVLSVLLTISLAARLELFRQIATRTQCITWSLEGLIPLLNAVLEYRTQKYPKQSLPAYLAPPFLLMAASFLAQLNDGWTSTYICTLTTRQAHWTRLMQLLAVALDLLILRGLAYLANSSVRYADLRSRHVSGLWGPVFLGAAALEVLTQACSWLSSDAKRSVTTPGALTFNVIMRSTLFTVMCTSASRIVLTLGMSGVSFLFVFVLTDAALIAQLYHGLAMYPDVPLFQSFLAIIALHLAAYLQCKTVVRDRFGGRCSRRQIIALRSILGASLAFCTFLFLRQTGDSPYHPINVLMERAAGAHRYFAVMAKQSTTLPEAVTQYERRYNRPPPPGFDAWWAYATNRSSLIIDDFDQINDDLLPFAALSPAELRYLTRDLISNPWNEVVAIHIRNGAAELQDGIKPTHRWMVKGVHKMVSKFARHLPDMDIPLNINDEPRVAVPWEEIEPKRAAGRWWNPDVFALTDAWSPDRAVPEVGGSKKMFVDLSGTAMFDRIARPTCPPTSAVRRTNVRDKRHVCLSCAAPHSLGQFLAKWTLSGDICHQPDILDLHGFFLAPGAFKVSQRLLPVFSQSRVSGFNDILYPSAWNYVDKAEYNPRNDSAWDRKYNAVFWRGGTTEGHAQDGNWNGMVRQRFAHLVNNHTHTPVSVLLPSKRARSAFSYTTLPGGDVQRTLGLNASVLIADSISRTEAADRSVQEREFGVVGKSDFQTHWRYKYLFDSDGAGFSGRFLSFLQSRSLPLRTGLFRQWLDGRVTAWVHYVPLDLRLHGFWSTVAYFAGARGVDGGVLMKGHDGEARRIAEQGREWAARTLRKEDMEVYMFRLLLEWGRLTDEGRERLGFRGG